jgi:hypothetical protein
MLRQFSLGTLGLVVGGILTVIGFVAYAADNATLNLVGFFYGIPLLLGGLALKANEIPPIPYTQPTTPQVLTLREKQATSTQTKVRKDLTRYWYGQDAHFDKSLEFLGLGSSDEDKPEISGLREAEINGAYALILEFNSPSVPIDIWQQKQEKMTNYFGPGVEVIVTQPDENQIELTLVVNSKG